MNQDYDKISKIQKKHKSPYLAGAKEPKLGVEDQNASTNSGISVGAEGRDIREK
ncbi:hypothetical protein JCM9140_840 [Halalkalibacter wakoensis JCM 9140]|uniref:Uncharacterized protein n=1 Tax=Halalkalibacter wakoensis JCM 9140 TaxID=1236970 RepID=W4PZH3_9BACI|nr:hypothetical protein [Halalkalibacter wakoensis]GAE24878.1 hypothetical protein JCM9140_840 [Halalkalibacter wakoensis JCM 9140]